MSAERGWIYVMGNVAYEGVYKIGASTNDPVNRASQLSAASGVPVPFTLVYQRKVDYPFQVEAALHRILAQYRINESREFFKVKLHKIIEYAERYDEVRDEFESDDVDTPFARLFSTFDDDGSPRELTVAEQQRCRELEEKLGQ